MLILSRQSNERIYLNIPSASQPVSITVLVCSINRFGEVKLGIDAPESVRIHRDDIQKLEPKP